MGRYSDSFTHRMRARRLAKGIKHPNGFKGMVMWCSFCSAEILRAPKVHRLTRADQQAAFDRHMTVCTMKDSPRLAEVRREIERGAMRRMRAQTFYRWRRRLLVLGILVAAVVGAALLLAWLRG